MQSHRPRHLHRQRGASIIEGLVVVTVLVVLLAVSVHFHHKYTAGVTSATSARAATWAAAIGGCRRNLELHDEIAGLLKKPAPADPRAVITGRYPIALTGYPELISRDSGSGTAVVAPCSELTQVKNAPLDQVEESLVRRLLGSW